MLSLHNFKIARSTIAVNNCTVNEKPLIDCATLSRNFEIVQWVCDLKLRTKIGILQIALRNLQKCANWWSAWHIILYNVHPLHPWYTCNYYLWNGVNTTCTTPVKLFLDLWLICPWSVLSIGWRTCVMSAVPKPVHIIGHKSVACIIIVILNLYHVPNIRI